MMATEPRIIQLVAAPDDADKQILVFRGKHCRDLCFPYATDDYLPVTQYRFTPHLDDPAFLSLRGAADYGEPAAYVEGLSIQDAPLSKAVIVPDPNNPQVMRAQAYTECYYCIKCFQDNDTAKPRLDFPASYANPRSTLIVGVHSLFDHTPEALLDCPPRELGLELGLNVPLGCGPGDCEEIIGWPGADVCYGPKDHQGTCDDLDSLESHVVANWSGCHCIACPCEFGTVWYGYLSVSVVTHCIRVDSGSTCTYRLITEICVSRLQAGSPAADCAFSGASTPPCYNGLGTWWACFETDPSLMCAPVGTYELTYPDAETGEPKCPIEVTIS